MNNVPLVLSTHEHLEIYRDMVATRYSEDVLANDVLNTEKKHCIGTAYLAPGHEAYSVGLAHALEEGDIFWPSHRDTGAHLVLGKPLKRAALRRFLNYFGKKNGPTRGTDGTAHDDDAERNIGTFISHMGAAAGVACGSAYSLLMEGKKNIALVSFGEGASACGRVHEAMNLAGTVKITGKKDSKKLPVVFCCYNNQWAESVPFEDEVAGSLADRFRSYGFKSVSEVDGNDVLAVLRAVRIARCAALEGTPSALVCATFRVGPHGQHEAPDKYVPKEDIERWKKPDRDPVFRFKAFLFETGILNEELEKNIFAEVKKEIDEAFDEAAKAPEPEWDESYDNVFAPSETNGITELEFPAPAKRTATYQTALIETLITEMKRNPKIVVFGEDIGWRMKGVHGELRTTNEKYGGSAKTATSLEEIFGHTRVFDTPISEEAIASMGVGMAWSGLRPIVWMQFADFVTTAISSVQDYAARMYWRTGRPLPWLMMMIYGGGTNSGPFHSQDNSAWFAQMPGLKIAVPGTPYDLAGLLRTSLRDQNPIMFYVHRKLFYTEKGYLPEEEYMVPFGKARVYNESAKSNFTIIAWGAMLREALKAAEELKPKGILAEVIDPRTLVPLDMDAILKSFKKTGFALITHEAPERSGFGAEIAAQLIERAPEYAGGIKRVCGKNTPVPHAPKLEKAYLPDYEKITEAAVKLWEES
ncbi:hypothetical protein HYT01_00045 [Candidatus Giovannonibacteria bacterium]|nr:hypothetical protein [Candidatus Giovannonibacteria bacterium]